MSIFAWKKKKPPQVETTCLLPKSLRVKVGNVEIASEGHSHWTVSVDGVPLRRLRKTVVKFGVDEASEVELTVLPDYSMQ